MSSDVTDFFAVACPTEFETNMFTQLLVHHFLYVRTIPRVNWHRFLRHTIQH